MYIMTPVLKTSCRLLLRNIVRYTFLNEAVCKYLIWKLYRVSEVVILDTKKD